MSLDAATIDRLRGGSFVFEALAREVGVEYLANGRRLLQCALVGQRIAATANCFS